MSQSCINDLSNLNASFYNFMVGAFASVIGGTLAGVAEQSREEVRGPQQESALQPSNLALLETSMQRKVP